MGRTEQSLCKQKGRVGVFWEENVLDGEISYLLLRTQNSESKRWVETFSEEPRRHGGSQYGSIIGDRGSQNLTPPISTRTTSELFGIVKSFIIKVISH